MLVNQLFPKARCTSPLARPVVPRRRNAFGVSWVLALLGWLPGACLYDANAPCSDQLEVYGDNQRCVCPDDMAWSEEGCFECPDHEVPGPGAGCVCEDGYQRPTGEAPCEPIPEAPEGLGAECDTEGMPCEGEFDHCEPVDGTIGYCTSNECTASDQCPGNYACDTETGVCRRPPIGAGTPCESDEDCADTEATFCDLFVTGTCLVEGCTLEPDDCFEGSECCDVSAFGIPEPLCVAEGACMP